MAIIKCPECGNDISNTCAYCIHCGYALPKPAPAPALEAAPVAEAASAEAPAAKPKKSKKKLIVIGAVVLAVIAAVAIFIISQDPFAFLYNSPSRTTVHMLFGQPDFSNSNGYFDRYDDIKFFGESAEFGVSYDASGRVVYARYEFSIDENADNAQQRFTSLLTKITKLYSNKFLEISREDPTRNSRSVVFSVSEDVSVWIYYSSSDYHIYVTLSLL